MLIENIQKEKTSLMKIKNTKNNILLYEYHPYPKGIKIMTNQNERSIIIWNNDK